MLFNNTYADRKVLITGNTGFKGSWLTTWLLMMGAKVFGFSNNIPTKPSMFETTGLAKRIYHRFGDVKDFNTFHDYVHEIKPDFIFHLAAQAIVSVSYSNPYETVATNVLGTATILESLKTVTWPCTCVIITSDKAYDNVEWIWGYRENDSLGGKDVYSGSKGAAELIIKSYWESFIRTMPNIRFGIGRAGNVIGGGDWAKDRIIVDCIRAFSNRGVVEIRSPMSTRPWQHVLEPLSGYLCLGASLHNGKCQNGEAYNFGPRAEQTKTVLEVTRDLAIQWGLEPNDVVKVTDNISFNEAALLKLNCDKALAYLKWHSTLNYEECIQLIAKWYKAFYTSKNIEMYELTLQQIKQYIEVAEHAGLEWTK